MPHTNNAESEIVKQYRESERSAEDHSSYTSGESEGAGLSGHALGLSTHGGVNRDGRAHESVSSQVLPRNQPVRSSDQGRSHATSAGDSGDMCAESRTPYAHSYPVPR